MPVGAPRESYKRRAKTLATERQVKKGDQFEQQAGLRRPGLFGGVRKNRGLRGGPFLAGGRQENKIVRRGSGHSKRGIGRRPATSHAGRNFVMPKNERAAKVSHNEKWGVSGSNAG